MPLPFLYEYYPVIEKLGNQDFCQKLLHKFSSQKREFDALETFFQTVESSTNI